MRFLKQLLKGLLAAGLILTLTLGGTCAAHAAVKKTVIFRDNILTSVIDRYLAGLKIAGVSVVMRVPAIKGVVLRLPDALASLALLDSLLVKAVVDDVDIGLQTMSATGEGGAGEGGAGSSATSGGRPLVRPFAKPDYVSADQAYRPWGVLNVYEHPYDPLLYMDNFDKQQIAELLRNGIRGAEYIKVAVFDTGIDYTHDKLAAVRDGIDVINFKPGIPMDDNGHGTHIAGTIAATDLGVANRVKLYAVKILDSAASGQSSNIVMGLQWAIDNDIDVVNMSVAYRQDNLAVRLAVKAAHEAGIVMVAAAGNFSNWIDDGASGEGGAGEGGAGEGGTGEGGAMTGGAAGSGYPVMYPAAYADVIATAAMDAYRQLAWFSNFGPEVDLLAPGVNVVSTFLNDGYGVASGTSMATPHVTGVVALMLGLARDENKRLRPDDVKQILSETAYRNGVVNLPGALERVLTLPDASRRIRLLGF